MLKYVECYKFDYYGHSFLLINEHLINSFIEWNKSYTIPVQTAKSIAVNGQIMKLKLEKWLQGRLQTAKCKKKLLQTS